MPLGFDIFRAIENPIEIEVAKPDMLVETLSNLLTFCHDRVSTATCVQDDESHSLISAAMIHCSTYR